MAALDDRAQLFSLGALIIAVLLILLATVLNSVIFVQNLDSRADTVGRTNPPTYADDVSSGFDGLMHEENTQYYSSYADLEAALTDGLTVISRGLAVEYAGAGHITDVTVTATSRGTNLTQNETQSLDRPGGDLTNTWTPATDVNASATAQISPKRDTLADEAASNPDLTDTLRITFSDGGVARDVYVYRNGTDVYVDARGDSIVDSSSCSVSTSSNRLVTVNFEQATLDGTDCPQLSFYSEEVEQTSAYSIEISTGATEEDGQYQWTLETPISNTDSNFDRSRPFDSGQYAKRIAFGIEYEIVYIDRLNEYTDSNRVRL